ncbi:MULTISPECIES: tryptophan--tRNA ligase [Paenibacillus]|uniref:Tryptophan--tRNA ligase n=2 Tax=Paenibacillus lactis TaxID=228574 RepID=G4HCX6_9BACL|nr:tryptophan--tRNA ligase [Paenibacillus lactis]EHB65902.1 tryptophanyl-tRNA synthetase [Paenibacillus lactis 154]MBP1891285.1 tryptophanyl-tRNA synthetase [Paenibacillus lactis]GIO92904.1 tryptophan--tRNA ligase [Paenibacillus lactis]HAF98342.1 tryptophan--tRNA ligase [Paenibacillus lactis]
MKRLLSGIKPSGDLNIGGYGGALRQYVKLQHEYDSYFFVPDLHAVTVYQDPKELHQRSRDIAALYIASGIDPDKATIFLQSQVPEHAQLGWLLETQAHFGELKRMTQFKEKSAGQDTVSSALFTYPVLMAADVLLYQATHVPVGDDQKQHLELTRDVAERFNNRYGRTFTMPEPIIQDIGSRVMGLDDPSKKMSKSNPNRNSCIHMMDTPEDIRKKFSKAVTDSDGQVRYDWENKPAVSNLIEIYSVFSEEEIPFIEKRYEGQGYGTFKKELAEVVIEKLQPIQEKFHQIVNSSELDRILMDGAKRASETAGTTLLAAKKAMGFVTF